MASIPSALTLSPSLPGCLRPSPPPTAAVTATSSFIPHSNFFPSFQHSCGQTRYSAVTLVRCEPDLSGSFFVEESEYEEDYEDDDKLFNIFGGDFFGTTAAIAAEAAVDREVPQCPPGLRQYETLTVLRPDLTEEERLAVSQKYEELLVAGGGMYVEVINRGVNSMAYDVMRPNKDGEKNTYLDGIFMLFTYFTKPESMAILEAKLRSDYDVIRYSSFKIKKQKTFK